MSKGEALINMISKGNREAFDSLCRESYISLLSYARLFLDKAAAEDVVQDVLMSVWQGRAGLKKNGKLEAYLFKSVYNRSMNMLNRSKAVQNYSSWYRLRINSMLSNYLSPENNPVIEKIYKRELNMKLNKAISALPERCRRVFVMHYLENMSEKEISVKLGISVSTVENHIYTALQRLRASLSSSE